MGRIDQVYLAADGGWTALITHDWLLLVALTAVTLAGYVLASNSDCARRR